ncbi:hypothetical protein BJP34_04615 [Moorena producens PAL-8-15-08-1]|uniref:Uncharacterized protein n=1 Tax=Moorena producens PAL-8-15-08-1 TaxID=1458985 RepID=A0A1D8TMH9_9CYAN|nr:hypothetical protein [Moorena producens]AOW98829.1 hypothetical protein BJP34_04615 [Moorena producens PAL-8-15-08-1]
MTEFLDVQNGLYNAMVQGLGLSENSFQLIQPSPPLVPDDDDALWNYFNNIPPVSLTQNYIASGGNQFFSNYKGFNSALTSVVESRLIRDVGQEIIDEFQDYIFSRNSLPSLGQLPSLFRRWAFFRYPNVANKGASAYAAALLDPVASAQLAFGLYEGDPLEGIPDKKPDWDLGYQELVIQLRSAPSRSFNFQRSTMKTDVTKTWSGGGHSGFFGLWRGSSSRSSESRKFANSNFTLTASFGHVLRFATVPGSWYSSAATGLAYSNRNGAPWNPESPINWNNTFDPKTGNIARLMVNLIVVDTMKLKIESFAKYEEDDQVTIRRNSGGGLWPFYSSGNSRGVSNTVDFDDEGKMTITVDSEPGVPIVIGGDVLPIHQYLGFAIEGARLFAEALEANPEFRDRMVLPVS